MQLEIAPLSLENTRVKITPQQPANSTNCMDTAKDLSAMQAKGWSLRLRRTGPANAERRTPANGRSPRTGCPTNPIHDRLAETHFRYGLNEDLLDVQLVHLSQ